MASESECSWITSSSGDPFPPPGQNWAFPETRWSLVINAAKDDVVAAEDQPQTVAGRCLETETGRVETPIERVEQRSRHDDRIFELEPGLAKSSLRSIGCAVRCEVRRSGVVHVTCFLVDGIAAPARSSNDGTSLG